MADNVGYTPGAGATVAADDIAGVLHQRVKIGVGADGTAVDVSTSNPLPVDASYGELVEAMEALRMATNSLTKSIGYALPNLQGQPIFEARQATAGNLNATVTGSLSSVTSVTSVTSVLGLQNQQQVGGFAANDQIPAFMHLQADTLRRNILVT
jgi:hypothetical protein